jgi:hypothetical protein
MIVSFNERVFRASHQQRGDSSCIPLFAAQLPLVLVLLLIVDTMFSCAPVTQEENALFSVCRRVPMAFELTNRQVGCTLPCCKGVCLCAPSSISSPLWCCSFSIVMRVFHAKLLDSLCSDCPEHGPFLLGLCCRRWHFVASNAGVLKTCSRSCVFPQHYIHAINGAAAAGATQVRCAFLSSSLLASLFSSSCAFDGDKQSARF